MQKYVTTKRMYDGWFSKFALFVLVVVISISVVGWIASRGQWYVLVVPVGFGVLFYASFLAHRNLITRVVRRWEAAGQPPTSKPRDFLSKKESILHRSLLVSSWVGAAAWAYIWVGAIVRDLTRSTSPDRFVPLAIFALAGMAVAWWTIRRIRQGRPPESNPFDKAGLKFTIIVSLILTAAAIAAFILMRAAGWVTR